MSSVQVEIHLPKLFAEAAEDIEAAVSNRLLQFLEDLGVPGNPAVKAYTQELQLPLKIVLNGQSITCPAELVQEIYNCINALPLSYPPRGIFNWETVNTDKMVAFARDIILETIQTRPSLLLAEAQFQQYCKKLDASSLSKQNKTELYKIAKTLLDLKIAIKDHDTISTALGQYASSKSFSADDLEEHLIELLSSSEVKIVVNKGYFQSLTKLLSSNDQQYFGLLRDGLFYELGTKYPRFTIGYSTDLDDCKFQFRINDVTGFPKRGLAPGEILVNDTPDRLTLLGIKAEPTVNPVNDSECGIISIEDESKAKAAGLTTWDAFGYLILYFSKILRSHGGCFVTNAFTENQLKKLSEAWPQLVNIIKETIPRSYTTKIFRKLIKEEISLRNLRHVVEAILNYDSLPADAATYIILDNRHPVKYPPANGNGVHLEDMVRFVRSTLAEYISHKYTRGGNTLMVYLLDPEIEAILDKSLKTNKKIEDHDREMILDAIGEETEQGIPGYNTPVILTVTHFRPLVKEMINDRFPRLPVLAYRELNPSMNIQPIARVHLPA